VEVAGVSARLDQNIEEAVHELSLARTRMQPPQDRRSLETE
jgi:hypothetical protein